jgi:hypothetical protein
LCKLLGRQNSGSRFGLSTLQFSVMDKSGLTLGFGLGVADAAVVAGVLGVVGVAALGVGLGVLRSGGGVMMD